MTAAERLERAARSRAPMDDPAPVRLSLPYIMGREAFLYRGRYKPELFPRGEARDQYRAGWDCERRDHAAATGRKFRPVKSTKS